MQSNSTKRIDVMKQPASLILVLVSLVAVSSAAPQDEDGDRRSAESRELQERNDHQRRSDADTGDKAAERQGTRDGSDERQRGARDAERHRSPERPRDGDRPRGEEFRPDGRRPPPGGPLIAALDRNRNGILESEEIDQAIVILRRMDGNRDGRLTAEELSGPGHQNGGRPPHDRDHRPGEREPFRVPLDRDIRRSSDGPPSMEQAMARFRAADANQDGRLSRDEAPERLKEKFDVLDGNKDGFVERREAETMVRQMRGGERERPEVSDPPRRRPVIESDRSQDRPREREADRRGDNAE